MQGFTVYKFVYSFGRLGDEFNKLYSIYILLGENVLSPSLSVKCFFGKSNAIQGNNQIHTTIYVSATDKHWKVSRMSIYGYNWHKYMEQSMFSQGTNKKRAKDNLTT